MFRFSKCALLLPLSLVSVPQAAHAANFGFVRWPDYLDMPILVAMILTGVSFLVFKSRMPEGAKDYVSVPKAERSALLKISAFTMLASLIICLGMIFVGMGLQRAFG